MEHPNLPQNLENSQEADPTFPLKGKVQEFYLSNIPTRCKEEHLLQFFSSFFKIEILEICKKRSGMNRGFGKLIMRIRDNQELREIINKSYLYQDKHLRLTPFIKENRESLKNIHFKQRVCVLGIPKTYLDHDLETAFNKFGLVKNAYIRIKKFKKKNLGFVTFQEERFAQLALAAKSIKIEDGSTLVISPFLGKRHKGEKQASPSLNSPKYKSGDQAQTKRSQQQSINYVNKELINDPSNVQDGFFTSRAKNAMTRERRMAQGSSKKRFGMGNPHSPNNTTNKKLSNETHPVRKSSLIYHQNQLFHPLNPSQNRRDSESSNKRNGGSLAYQHMMSCFQFVKKNHSNYNVRFNNFGKGQCRKNKRIIH